LNTFSAIFGSLSAPSNGATDITRPPAERSERAHGEADASLRPVRNGKK
jgi:hypothetical protein